MSRLSDGAARIAASLWFGSGVFLIAVAAPAAFRGASSSTSAADIVGRMLVVWHYLALLVPLFLLLREWYGRSLGRTAAVIILAAALVLAAIQGAADIKIRKMRSDSLISMSQLPKNDPVRREFGMLHGISSLLMLGEILCAGAFVLMSPIFRETPESPAHGAPLDVEDIQRRSELHE